MIICDVSGLYHVMLTVQGNSHHDAVARGTTGLLE